MIVAARFDDDRSRSWTSRRGQSHWNRKLPFTPCGLSTRAGIVVQFLLSDFARLIMAWEVSGAMACRPRHHLRVRSSRSLTRWL